MGMDGLIDGIFVVEVFHDIQLGVDGFRNLRIRHQPEGGPETLCAAELCPDFRPGHPEGFLSLAVDAARDERGGVFPRPVIDFSQQDKLSVLDADEVGAE